MGILADSFEVDSPNVRKEGDTLVSSYDYSTTEVEQTDAGGWRVRPVSQNIEFQTDLKVPKLGCACSALPGRCQLSIRRANREFHAFG